MKILMIEPGFPGHIKEYLMLPSLELCIASAILKKEGHQVELLDMRINGYPAETVTKYLPLEKPDIIYMDDELSTHCESIKIAKAIKSVWGNTVPIAIRGEVASFVPERMLSRHPEFDYAVRFDEDYAILDLLRVMQGKTTISEIRNLAYRDANGVVHVSEKVKRPYQLMELPMPDRELYDVKKYLQRDSETIVRSTRGCVGGCLFCSKTRMAQFGMFTPQRFCDEIQQLQNYGFDSFFFSDDTFAFSDQRLKAFYDEVVSRKMDIRWTSNIRIKDINDYKLQHMKEIGAYRVFVGIESVNDRTQGIIKKNLVRDEILHKVDLLHKYDMEFHASFILGNPGDCEEDLKDMEDFVKEIKPTLVTFNLIKLVPGMDIYENREKYGYVLDDPFWYEGDEWTKKVVAGTNNLSTETLEYWSRHLLMEFIKG